MTSKKLSGAVASVHWIERHGEKFLKSLRDLGYTTATLRTYDASAFSIRCESHLPHRDSLGGANQISAIP